MAWNSDTIYALKLQRIIAQILGIWPEATDNVSLKMRVIFVAIVEVWICFDIIKQFIVKGYYGSIIDLVEVITKCVSTFTIAIKMIVITVYRQNLYFIITSIIEDWVNVVDEKSRSIMLQYARIGRLAVIVQFLAVFPITCQMIFAQMQITEDVWNEKSNSSVQLHGLPIWPMCWIPPDISPYNLTVHFIVQAIALFVSYNSYAIFNATLYSIAIHLCGQFQVLHNNLKAFHQISDPVQFNCLLTEFIERHSHLLVLADAFETTYNLNILAELGLDIILICVLGVVLLIGLQNSDFEIISGMLVRIFSLKIGIFVHSYIGEQLNRKSEIFHMAIYNIPWYNIPPSTAKKTMFIMMRCSHPFNLTAGKIYTMNCCNFMGILKTIFSYFSVIRLMF